MFLDTLVDALTIVSRDELTVINDNDLPGAQNVAFWTESLVASVAARPTDGGRAMLLLKPQKAMWTEFCNGITGQIAGKSVNIEIASRDRGVQQAARANRLVRVGYDRSGNTLEIVIEGRKKLVVQPAELYAEFGLHGLETIGILDSESAWEIVWLRDPPMLPSPLSISPR